MLSEQQIVDALRPIQEPSLHKSLVEVGAIKEIKINGSYVSLKVALSNLGTPEQVGVQNQIIQAVKAAGAETVGLRFAELTSENQQQGSPAKGTGDALLSKDSKTVFIAVTSGKGGVGKSTVTVNLATALARQGKRVGVIDADIYGFSVPDMMGIDSRPQVVGEVIYPVERKGVKVMSMGFFVEDNAPVIWRGPMLGKMLRNFFSEVHWGELDYMILDLPPGTGDVALDVHQMLPESKEIIVTTPHSTAAFVAARAGSMALKTNHEILGVVENMSYYQLPDGTKDCIFGQGGGEKLADVLDTELIAQIPLGQPVKEQDETATALYTEGTLIGDIYSQLAKKVMQKVVIPSS
ncbi:Mrp/NBP35 family ATP-binding protein [Caldalkalibacillus mannanilyticus]|uniref:Mrp/NBP35 family ATP-binding protein n=1 Tax=Caldalkalibacillus mannanilyticus TaxID=1418 RepID=UPI000468168C|nr:Mrp/NBP35 family ATP-binding protein [Caldalkalibacillus mannanilyticus]